MSSKISQGLISYTDKDKCNHASLFSPDLVVQESSSLFQ